MLREAKQLKHRGREHRKTSRSMSTHKATMLETLYALGITPSRSRPRVSNDNAYAESLFKTLKYVPDYQPQGFKTLDEARVWVRNFVNWYNNEHRHSGINYVTPEQRHNGEDREILEKRKEVYAKAKEKHPERWSGEIRDWSFSEEEWLNPKQKKGNRKRGKGLIDFKERKVGRVTTTQKNSAILNDRINKVKKILQEKTNIFLCNLGIEERWNDDIFSSNNNIYKLNNVEEISILLCKKEDILFLRKKPDINYIKYMNEIGFSIPKMIVMSNEENIEEFIISLYNKKKEIINHLKKNYEYRIIPYAYDKKMDIFPDNCKWIFKDEFIKEHNDKIVINKLMKENGIDCPPSYYAWNYEECEDYYNILIGLGFKRIVLKLPFGAAGKGSFIINDKRELKFISKLYLKKTKGPILVEGFFENAKNYNYQLYISDNGEIDVFFISEQSVKDTSYQGTFFGKELEKRLKLDEIREEALRVGKVLFNSGIEGVVGIDGIECNEKYYPAIDVNVRFTMSTYLCKVKDVLCKNMSYYTTYFDVTYDEPMTYENILKILENNYLLYDKCSKKGVIVYLDGTLPKIKNRSDNYYVGRIYMIISAETFEECQHYYENAKELFRKKREK